MKTKERVLLKRHDLENAILFYEQIREYIKDSKEFSMLILAKTFELKYKSSIGRTLVELNYLRDIGYSRNGNSGVKIYKLLYDKQLEPIDVRRIYEHCYDLINGWNKNPKHIVTFKKSEVKNISMTEGNDISQLKSEVFKLQKELKALKPKEKIKYKYQFPFYINMGFRKIRVKK